MVGNFSSFLKPLLMASRNLTQNRCLRTLDTRFSSGESHVIIGPMFAGKTTTLLRRPTVFSLQASPRRNSLHLDKTLKDLCYSGRLSAAVGVLCQSQLHLDPQTYALLLQECIFRKEFRMGKRVHARMVIVGFSPNEYLKIKLLILYAKSGNLVTAHLMFDKLPYKSLISWNAMISGYVQKGLYKMGLELYHRMRRGGLIPDQFTFASVFRALASLATLEQGKQAHGVMIKIHIGQNVVVNSALMDMYFKCSNPADGHLVFEKSLNKNVITWTALISGYGQNGKFEEVLKHFHMMKNNGFKPNHVTFLAVLCACSHGGLINEGWIYFSSMARDYGIHPNHRHYAAMVDLLGRADRLKEAYEFIINSPSSEHPVVWSALLWACKEHGDIDLLKLAAKKYFQLESNNPDKYVVLSCAFATFGLWDNAAVVRGAMKESGMKKEPACSRIEVQGEVHIFLMGDKSHKLSELIYKLIKEMNCILNDVTYSDSISD